MPASTSLRRKMLLVVLTTTCAALLLSATALLIYELRSFRTAWIDDLTTQADLISRSSAPALAFDDIKAASENVAMLKHRPQIRAAAVYAPDGDLFATYASVADVPPSFPAAPGPEGPRFVGDQIEIFQRIEQNGELLGTVYLRAHYDVTTRLWDYMAILAAVTGASLLVAALIFSRLQHAVTMPILAVAAAARRVMETRDYSLRVPKQSQDEVGVLVDAFNDMLTEVGRRTQALERSNRELSIEMEERQKAEAALLSADRRKDEFLATLAHELRNPLAPLSNGLEILKLADADPASRARVRAIMERQLKQMVRLIDDLLEVSRITTGKLALRRERLDLVAVLRSAIEIVEPAMRERGHELSTALPDTPAWVDGDATRLSQVFANLLNNAVKYTDPGGHIEVSLGLDAGRATLRVSDNGIGIEPEMQAAIFEMFMQVDKSLERGRAGLGVGLTLAQQLVELHGGSISVHSAGVGHGSEFIVTLPLCEAPALPVRPPGPVESTVVPPVSVPLRVLVADDNADFASSLGSMLQSLGHRVSVVHDGRAALHAALSDPPDVCFFDIGMPGLNGYDLAARLRAHEATRTLVLVAVTGWGQESDREQARRAGFDHHLVKPIELAQVVPVLEAARQSAPRLARSQAEL
ncbi:ATP-binding protein [Caldimonas brevitalea]|uniref:histidine kinase n=1 Tax=Caldimonas brevitalea TaxID=413882 RepID=A0A0G3BMU6_9BURK|nr:ATP-binding protein [Caldimonas brevitalea]AKJ27850.1 chemotaxis protein methyltransferase CheR [Caldimonas brevitalea]